MRRPRLSNWETLRRVLHESDDFRGGVALGILIGLLVGLLFGLSLVFSL